MSGSRMNTPCARHGVAHGHSVRYRGLAARALLPAAYLPSPSPPLAPSNLCKPKALPAIQGASVRSPPGCWPHLADLGGYIGAVRWWHAGVASRGVDGHAHHAVHLEGGGRGAGGGEVGLGGWLGGGKARLRQGGGAVGGRGLRGGGQACEVA